MQPHIKMILKDIAIFLLVILATVIAIQIVKFTVRRAYIIKKESPWLIYCYKNATTQRVLDNVEFPILRSNNESKGLEYSYCGWIFIDSLEYPRSTTEKKHVFHKGDFKQTYVSPGMYIHPTENKLIFRQDTLDDSMNEMIIEDVPLKKWIHFTFVVRQKKVYIFINGRMSIYKQLNSLPKQNPHPIYINLHNGFSGYISRFRYFNYAISNRMLQKMIRKGPSKIKQDNALNDGVPRYFLNNFWNQ